MSKIYIKGEEVITKNNEPIASEETLGMVKIGQGIQRESDGTISVSGGGTDIVIGHLDSTYADPIILEDLPVGVYDNTGGGANYFLKDSTLVGEVPSEIYLYQLFKLSEPVQAWDGQGHYKIAIATYINKSGKFGFIVLEDSHSSSGLDTIEYTGGYLTGNATQIISGEWYIRNIMHFETLPKSSVTPTNNDELVNKAYVDSHAGSNIQVITGVTSQNPFIWTEHTPGIYAIVDDTSQSLSTIYIKATQNSNTIALNCSGFIILCDNTIEDTYVEPITKGFIQTTDATVKTMVTQPSPYDLDVSVTQGIGNAVVKTSDPQTISGRKTFTTLPQSSVMPTDEKDFTNKAYVDSVAGGVAAEDTFNMKGHVTSADLLPGDNSSYSTGAIDIETKYDSTTNENTDAVDVTQYSQYGQYYVVVNYNDTIIQTFYTDYPECLYYYTSRSSNTESGILVKYDPAKPVYTAGYPSGIRVCRSDYVGKHNRGAIRTNCELQVYDPIEFMGDRSSYDDYNSGISVTNQYYSASTAYGTTVYPQTTWYYKVLEDDSHFNYGPKYKILEPTSILDDHAKIYYRLSPNTEGDTYTVGDTYALYRWQSNEWVHINDASEILMKSFNIKGNVLDVNSLPGAGQPSAGTLTPSYSWNQEFNYKGGANLTVPTGRTHTYFLTYQFLGDNYGDGTVHTYMIETDYPEQIMCVENGSTWYGSGTYADRYHRGFYLIYDANKPVFVEGKQIDRDCIAEATGTTISLNFELTTYDPTKLSGDPTMYLIHYADGATLSYRSIYNGNYRKYPTNSNFHYAYPDGSKYYFGAGYKIVKPVSETDFRAVVWTNDGSPIEGDTYFVGSTRTLYRYTNFVWTPVALPDLSNFYTKSEVDAMINNIRISITDIQEELWGIPQNWIDEGTYLDRPYTFRSIASLKNINTTKSITVTMYSQSLVDPWTTTLQPGGQMSVVDAGFDYDDMRAAWTDPNETAPLSEIQESLYFKWS